MDAKTEGPVSAVKQGPVVCESAVKIETLGAISDSRRIKMLVCANAMMI